MDDCGGAFTMGAIGGGVFQAVKGFRNAPAVSVLICCFPPCTFCMTRLQHFRELHTD